MAQLLSRRKPEPLLQEAGQLDRERWIIAKALRQNPFDPGIERLTDLQRDWIIGQIVRDADKAVPPDEQDDPVTRKYRELIQQDEAAETLFTDEDHA